MENNNLTFITADEAVSQAMLSLGSEDTRDRLIFKEWIYRAERQIGYNALSLKTACVDVNDFTFDKPCDMAQVIDIELYDSSGTLSTAYEFRGSGFFPSENSLSRNVVMKESDFEFVISSNATNVSRAEIKYYAFPIDEDKNILIPEIHLEAVIAFCEFMYIKRERNLHRDEIPMSEVQYNEDRWHRMKADAKGKTKMPSILNAKDIMKRWMTLVPDMSSRGFRSV
jgi:hypothetical protein